MDFFFDELLLSIVSILLALFIGKLVSTATGYSADDSLNTFDRSPIGGSIGSQLQEEEHTLIEPRADDFDLESEEKLLKGEVYEFDLQEKEEEEGGKDEGSLLRGEDEWEGVERSELEKRFRAAAEYVDSESGGTAMSKLSSDVRMQLYGLRKVATEGPCYKPQPMVFKLSARAKWHAWKRLGNMNPDASMEQYISLLSDTIPGWMGGNSKVEAKDDRGNSNLDRGTSETCNPDIGSFSHGQPSSETHRKLEDLRGNEADVATTSSNVFEKAKDDPCGQNLSTSKETRRMSFDSWFGQ